jgi:excisionase family DNA binding protein
MSAVGSSPRMQEHSPGEREWITLRKDEIPQLEDRLLRAAEVQRKLGVSRATAYRMMTDGTLPAYRFGGRNGRRAMIRVSLKELRGWIAAHRAASSSAA